MGHVAEILPHDPDDRVGVGVRVVVHRGQHRQPRTGHPQSRLAQQRAKSELVGTLGSLAGFLESIKYQSDARWPPAWSTGAVGPGWFNADVGTQTEDFLRAGRPSSRGSSAATRASWSTFRVRGQTFGYLWERTQTVGLKQLLSEQLALVAERPDVFEVQFTAGQFGWVVVYLERIDRDELAELTYEAWSADRAGRPGRGRGRRAADARRAPDPPLTEVDGERRLGHRRHLLLGHPRRQRPQHQPVRR